MKSASSSTPTRPRQRRPPNGAARRQEPRPGDDLQPRDSEGGFCCFRTVRDLKAVRSGRRCPRAATRLPPRPSLPKLKECRSNSALFLTLITFSLMNRTRFWAKHLPLKLMYYLCLFLCVCIIRIFFPRRRHGLRCCGATFCGHVRIISISLRCGH